METINMLATMNTNNASFIYIRENRFNEILEGLLRGGQILDVNCFHSNRLELLRMFNEICVAYEQAKNELAPEFIGFISYNLVISKLCNILKIPIGQEYQNQSNITRIYPNTARGRRRQQHDQIWNKINELVPELTN